MSLWASSYGHVIVAIVRIVSIYIRQQSDDEKAENKRGNFVKFESEASKHFRGKAPDFF